MSTTDNKRGGQRENAGRKKVGGRQHLWTIPSDIEEIAKAKGTAYLWECVRFKYKLDKDEIVVFVESKN